MPAPAETLPVVATHIYPGIDPERFKGIHKEKVVLITGGGVGLGFHAAKAFSQCGAKVFLTGRRLAPLEAAKAEIEASSGEADFAQMDVADAKSVQEGVDAAVKRFGKLDIVIANAGRDYEMGNKLGEFEVDEWWTCVEVNLKGSFLTAHATLPHLVASKGYIILLTSGFAQTRFEGSSCYNIAKHSVNRLAEWIDIEYRDQGVKSFAVHPGGVATDFATKIFEWMPSMREKVNMSPNLSAWTYVRLTSGSEDWLSGRVVFSTASLDELDKMKEKIIEQDALKNRLALPI